MSEGWSRIGSSEAAHYFRNGRSLCGRWTNYTTEPVGMDGHRPCFECCNIIRKEGKEAGLR